MGSKFDTDSRGLSPKATGLHLDGLGGDSLGSFPLVGPRSRARTADPRTLVSIRYKTRNLARGSRRLTRILGA